MRVLGFDSWRVTAPDRIPYRVVHRGWANLLHFESFLYLTGFVRCLTCTEEALDPVTQLPVGLVIEHTVTRPQGMRYNLTFKSGRCVVAYSPLQPWRLLLRRRVRFIGNMSAAPGTPYDLLLYVHGEAGRSQKCSIKLFEDNASRLS